MKDIRLEIPMKLPSGNKWRRRPWYYEESWKRKIAKEIPPLIKPRRARKSDKRRLSICRVLGPGEREYDRANLYRGAKPLEDALVAAGYLWDDDPRHCDLRVTQNTRLRAGGAKILIVIKAVK